MSKRRSDDNWKHPIGIIHTMDSRQIIRRLEQDGWRVVATKGSHHHYRHPGKPGRVTVPHPKRDIPLGTLRSIFRQAGWAWPPRK